MHAQAVSPSLALRIENCEVAAWVDMYKAISADYARHRGQPGPGARHLRQGRWDCIFRSGAQTGVLRPGEPADYTVEEVNAATAMRWTTFIDKTYGMPTGPWLAALVGRRGWHHYLFSRSGRGVCARSVFMADDRTAWLCIDAPAYRNFAALGFERAYLRHLYSR